MKTTARMALTLVVVLAMALVISGCSSGSPPSQQPRNVTGTVVNLDTGAGVAGVMVSIGGVDAEAVTDANGSFTVDGVLAPGSYAVVASGATGLDQAGQVTVTVPVGTTPYDMGKVYMVSTPPSPPSP